MQISFFLFMVTFVFNAAAAEEIFSCVEDQSTMMSWENKGIFSKAGLKGEAGGPSKKPTPLTVLVTAQRAVIKGNVGQSDLKKIGENVYIEETTSGNIVTWTILKSTDRPTYIIQHKAYVISNPFTITVAYKCN